jgi:hypothetical protein
VEEKPLFRVLLIPFDDVLTPPPLLLLLLLDRELLLRLLPPLRPPFKRRRRRRVVDEADDESGRSNNAGSPEQSRNCARFTATAPLASSTSRSSSTYDPAGRKIAMLRGVPSKSAAPADATVKL